VAITRTFSVTVCPDTRTAGTTIVYAPALFVYPPHSAPRSEPWPRERVAAVVVTRPRTRAPCHPASLPRTPGARRDSRYQTNGHDVAGSYADSSD